MRLSTLFAILGLALVMTLGLPAQTVRVIFVSGQASLQRPDEASLRPAVKGETVIIGTRIVTGADGRLVLTPMPGVKSIITPNTTILLESSAETRTSDTNVTHQAVIELKEGAVVSDLQKPEGVTYDYSIRTARGLAGARGTTFTVGINAAGIQTVVVAHGVISINFTDGRQATLALGHLSITRSTGDTQSVGNVGELPEADQKIAKNWTEITLTALADALENGIEVDPAALNNALDAAKSLGIIPSPEVQAAVDRALATVKKDETLFHREETADPLKTVIADNNNKDEKPQDIISPPPAEPPVEPPPPEPPPPEPTPVELFRARLQAEQRPAFDGLPVDIQTQLATLNDVDIAGVALSPDNETGLPLTYQDLRLHLTAFSQLSPEALAFVKTLAGAHLAEIDKVPDPAKWSPAAFERTLASWNALSDAERSLIRSLGAGEAIMDTSTDYISALLSGLDTAQLAIISETGWGAYLDQLSGKPTAQNIFNQVGDENLGATGRAIVKFFGISPDYFSYYNYNTFDVVNALAAASPAEREILRQLGIDDLMLSYRSINTAGFSTYGISTDYAARISNVLSFYSSLTADEQKAARALGLGSLLYNYAPSETLGESTVTALQRARELAGFYLDHPSLQQALQDSELLSQGDFISDPTPLNITLITETLETYGALPERTRTYLAAQQKAYSFLYLAHPELANTYSNTLRPLADINAVLGALSSAEFATLLDLDLGRVVFERGDLSEGILEFPFITGSPIEELKTTIGYYQELDSAQKYVLRELGIIGNQNIAIVGADIDGLGRLLTAYGTLPGTLRASTERLDENNAYYSRYGSGEEDTAVKDRSFFFARNYNPDTIIYAVRFVSTGDLYVGATQYLRIDGTYLEGTNTFTVGAGKDLYLHAANLIDLNATGFSSDIRGITMAAHTINLANITFPEGSVASLNSKYGELNFEASLNNGKVNFTGVRYGNSESAILNADNFHAETRGYIAIGTLKNPAPLPTYPPRNTQ